MRDVWAFEMGGMGLIGLVDADMKQRVYLYRIGLFSVGVWRWTSQYISTVIPVRPCYKCSLTLLD